MPAESQIKPFREAISRLGKKRLAPGTFRTEEWAQLPAELRNGAFFSAGVTELRVLSKLQEKLGEWAEMARINPEQALMSKGRFVSEMAEVLGEKAIMAGSEDISDITSSARLELIYDFQQQNAMEYGIWKAGQSETLLDAFPCQELLRVESRIEPRDWPERWREAGGEFYAGERMIARKDDEIWVEISAFGNPWPPFDWGSGMGVEDVDRIEAEELGVIAKDDRVPPGTKGFTDSLEADVSDVDEDLLESFMDEYGDRIEETAEGKLRWKEAA